MVEAMELAGDPFTIGRRHGEAFGSSIRSFLDNRLALINAIRHTPLSQSDADAIVDAHARVIEMETPALAEELRGLSTGAGITYRQAVLLQVRRELIGWSGTSGECSTLASRLAADSSVIAQNVDLIGKMRSLARVVRIRETGVAGGEVLMLTFAGLLGFLGINAAGLALGINFTASTGWRPGVSPYLLVRHLLKQASLDHCIEELRRITRASTRCFILCHAGRLMAIEMTMDDIRVIEGQALFHTNHYLHHDLVERDAMNPFSRRSSQLRLQTIQALSRSVTDLADPEALFGILSDHSHYPVGLCAHGEGEFGRDETVAAVVLYPARGRMYVRHGNPCRANTFAHQLTIACHQPAAHDGPQSAVAPMRISGAS